MIRIELKDEDALVLFEFLARHDDMDNSLSGNEEISTLTLEDKAELYSLWQLQGALEKILVEPFRPDYDILVNKAREKVRARREE